MSRRVVCLVTGLVLFAAGAAQTAESDPLLRAMHDELNRSLALRLVSLEAPYYIAYQVDDGEFFTGSATLGSVIGSNHTRARIPRVQVRVGNYDFDNTNYVASGFILGSHYDVDRLPLDDEYMLLRRYFWLSTDQTYKSAIEAIARKRAAMKNLSASEPGLPDFARAEPNRMVLDVSKVSFDPAPWLARVSSLSAEFGAFPEVINSVVEYQATRGSRYLVTSEDTELRVPEMFMQVRARATALAPDGMRVRDEAEFLSIELNRLPKEGEMASAVRRLAENVTALAKAPLGDTYNGPVLFEGVAGAQVVGELMGRNLTLTRKPVTEPGRAGSFSSSDLEGRQGARVLPEWMDVVDDPSQAEWHGHQLAGFYRVDEEGVIPKPVTLVEKGILKNYLLTRQPVRGYNGSNGRARLPGNFGAQSAAFTNLFVNASQTTSLVKLKKRMMELCQARGRPYGIIVRKMDFPSSASVDEARRLLSSSQGGTHPASLPLLVYRVYPDGREELVRGMRFKGFNVRSLKDIVAVGDDNHVFEYLENGAPFALIGAASYAAESAVIAPSLLVDDLEMARIEEEFPRPPVVAAPTSAQ